MKTRSESQGRERLVVPAQFKADEKTGRFSGYASIYGNVDLGGDVILPGAFKEIVKNDSGKVIVLWQHNTREPFGVAALEDDEKGLGFDAEAVMEDPVVRGKFAHLRAGTVRGMSIGYDVLPGGAKILESGIRQLSALKLWELSVVTFGMNPLAGVDEVKQFQSIREFEAALREGRSFSWRAAKAIAAKAWPLDEIRDGSAGATMEEIAGLFEGRFLKLD